MNYEGQMGDSERLTFDSEPPRRRRRLWWVIGLLLVAAALAVAFFGMRRGPAPDAGAAKAEAGAAKGDDASGPPVTVMVPGTQTVRDVVTGTGSLAARRDMPVGVAGEGGLVTRVLVEQGQWVSAGQVLATVDRSVQSQTVESLSAQIRVARADATLAQSELDRAQTLLGRGFISKADIDRKTATRDAARARVRVAEAQLAEAQARNRRLDIRAPAAGLVLTRQVEPGQIVSAGSGVLFRIAMGGELELRTLLSEADLTRVKPGMQATVTPVGSDRTFSGQIWQVAPVIDPQTRQGTARIAVAYDPALRPGGFATGAITVGAATAPLLPESAVHSDAKGNYVYVLDAQNKVERRAIRTGSVSDAGVPIVEGLTGNERVVVLAGAFLNPGQKVKPVQAK